MNLVRHFPSLSEQGQTCRRALTCGHATGPLAADETVRFSRALEDLEIYLEQPCYSYEECPVGSPSNSRHPVKLDELEFLGRCATGLADTPWDANGPENQSGWRSLRHRVIRDVVRRCRQ